MQAFLRCWPLQIRFELAEKELALLQKQVELLEKDQTLAVLKEEVRLSAFYILPL